MKKTYKIVKVYYSSGGDKLEKALNDGYKVLHSNVQPATYDWGFIVYILEREEK